MASVPDTSRTTATQLQNVTLPQMQAVIETAFPSPDEVAIVLIGDAAKLREQVAAVTGRSPKCRSPSPDFDGDARRTWMMPELPDITVYVEALRAAHPGRAGSSPPASVHPFLLRTFEPPLAALHGRRVVELRRVGKRVAIGFEGDQWLVLHLMIAGRLHWFATGARKTGRAALAYFVFDTGTLTV